MAENKEYLTHTEENGAVHIAEDVVAAIASEAIGQVEGVGAMSQNMGEQLSGKRAVRGIRACEEGEQVVLDVYLMVRYGFEIPAVARKVQESVAGAVGSMTGFPVRQVNVHVSGISFND